MNAETKIHDNPTEATRANTVEATEAAARRFVDEHPSPRIDRYLDLLDAVEAATPKGFRQAALKPGPMAYFVGAERDLAELCVGRR